MTATDSFSSHHAARDLAPGSAALLALGDAGLDGTALRYLSVNDHALAADSLAAHHATPFVADEDDDDCGPIVDSFCPTPDRCARNGCRDLCRPSAA